MPPAITDSQLREVLLDPELRNIDTSSPYAVKVQLAPLAALPCPVLISQKAALNGFGLTAGKLLALSGLPFLVIGEDANLKLTLGHNGWLPQDLTQPLVLGTKFNFNEGPDPERLSARDILVLSKNEIVWGALPNKPELIERLSATGEKGAALSLARQLKLKDLVKAFEVEAAAEERQLAEEVIGTFERLKSGDLDLVGFIDALPENRSAKLNSQILREYLLKNINPENYRVIRKFMELSLLFDELVDKYAETIYDQVLTLKNIKPEQLAVLRLIVSDSEYEFLPPADWMPKFQKRYEKGASEAAKLIYENFFAGDMTAAGRLLEGQRGLIPAERLAQSWEHVKRGMEVYPQKPGLKEYAAMILYLWACRLESAGDLTGTAAKLEESLSYNSNYADALDLLGRTYVRLENWQGAIPAAEKLARLDPNNATNLNTLGYAYFSKYVDLHDPADLEKALLILDKGFEVNKSRSIEPFLFYNLAVVNLVLGNFDQAAHWTLRRTELGQPVFNLMRLTVTLLCLPLVKPVSDEQFAELIERLSLAAENSDIEKNAHLLIDVYKLLQNKGYPLSAARLLEKLRRAAHPGFADYLQGLGLFQQKKFPEAAQYLRQAMEQESGLMLFNDLLDEYYSLRNEAANMYLICLDQFDKPAAQRNSAWLAEEYPSGLLSATIAQIFESSDAALARRHYERAIELHPHFLLPRLFFASLWREVGNRTEYEDQRAGLLAAAKEAIAAGKTGQFTSRELFLMELFEERRLSGHPLLDELCLLIERKFPEKYRRAEQLWREKGKE